LSQTIDYVKVNEIVKAEMSIPSKLIEHVGKRIYTRTKEELPTCTKLEVHIQKKSPPINGDVESVAIKISDF
jgi:dihydroneopterin aldolase